MAESKKSLQKLLNFICLESGINSHIVEINVLDKLEKFNIPTPCLNLIKTYTAGFKVKTVNKLKHEMPKILHILCFTLIHNILKDKNFLRQF